MSLERIEVTPFALIAGEILQNRRSGFLTILAGALRRVLYFSQGELIMSASPNPADSLAEFLVRRGAITTENAAAIFGNDPNDAVAKLHEAGLLDLSSRQTLMREWLAGQFIPLFSLEEGTTAFTEDEPLAPDRRIFLPSTAGLILEAVRSIDKGLVLRRSLGDMKRTIRIAPNNDHPFDTLPLHEQERAIASSLTEPEPIETFLKRYAAQSSLAAKILVAMLAIGVYTDVPERRAADIDPIEMQRDMEMLAAIGPNDTRSLRVAAYSKTISRLDHYQILHVPRAAARNEILASAEAERRQYNPVVFPPAVRDAVASIRDRIDEALKVLRDPARRAAYDKVLATGVAGESAEAMQQKTSRRNIAVQNVGKAKELIAEADYYGAIVLLRQAVKFLPDLAEAWSLLGSCQERNPQWRREAAESFQMALSIDPNSVGTLIALGDLYRSQGLATRAQTCYDDALKIDPENELASSRLQALKKR